MYLLLHRALRNAGDYLIHERAARLLGAVRPSETVHVGLASASLAEQFDRRALQGYRAILIAGGPGYAAGMTRRYPLGNVADLPPIVFLAGGSFVIPGASRQLERTRLPDDDMVLLRAIAERAPFLGARDGLTAGLLRRWGLPRVEMGGDPAWYDLDHIDGPVRVPPSLRRIAFTPPANPAYRGQAVRLVKAIRARWPSAHLDIVEHRGRQPRFARLAAKVGATVLDIGGSTAGFAIYDEVDVHIGYRVHAHLYSLSRGTPTYLVAEDSRGVGVLDEFPGLGEPGFRDAGEARWTGEALRVLAFVDQRRPAAVDAAAEVVARIAGFPAIEGTLPARIADDLGRGFPGHLQARETIRRTLPRMRAMIEMLP